MKPEALSVVRARAEARLKLDGEFFEPADIWYRCPVCGGTTETTNNEYGEDAQGNLLDDDDPRWRWCNYDVCDDCGWGVVWSSEHHPETTDEALRWEDYPIEDDDDPKND